MRKIVILGVSKVGAKYLPESLRAIGYDPVFVFNPSAYAEESLASLATCRCYPVDVGDRRAVLRLFAGQPEIIRDTWAITGGYDELFPLIRELATVHGVPGIDPVLAALASKHAVARLVPEYCPPTVRFTAAQWAGTDPQVIAPGADGFYVKPDTQAGGRGATALPASAGPRDVRDAIAASGLPAGDSRWVLQPAIAGELISLEGYVADGRIRFLGFSLRGRIGGTETSNLFPADDHLDAVVRTRCQAAVTALAERAGVRGGYFHSEFLIGAEHSYLLDANMGRVGGGSIVEQIAMAHGLWPGDILNHMLTLGLPGAGVSQQPEYLPDGEAQATMSISYGLDEDGVVEMVRPRPGGRCVHTPVIAKGGRVAAVGVDDTAWVGILTGLRDDAMAEIGDLVIETGRGPRRPAYVTAGSALAAFPGGSR
jgi:hypothetical protein